MQSIKEIYIMSGVFLQPGNVSPVAEANAYGDPVTTQFVINQSKKFNNYSFKRNKFSYLTSK